MLVKLLVNIGVGPPVSGSPGFIPWLKCIANSSTSALMLWSLVHKGLCSPRLVRFCSIIKCMHCEVKYKDPFWCLFFIVILSLWKLNKSCAQTQLVGYSIIINELVKILIHYILEKPIIEHVDERKNITVDSLACLIVKTVKLQQGLREANNHHHPKYEINLNPSLWCMAPGPLTWNHCMGELSKIQRI